MERLAIFIDGSNLHGALGLMTKVHREQKKISSEEYYNMDFKKLIECLNPNKDKITKIYYARSETAPELEKRKYFYRALNGMGIKLDIKERLEDRKEKGVDMAVAMEMLILAFHNYYDNAILVARDGDYCQLIKEVQRYGKMVGIAAMAYGLSERLVNEADLFIDLEHCKGLISIETGAKK